MRNVIGVNKWDVINNQKINAYINLSKQSDDYVKNNPVSEILNSEGGEIFYQYIDEIGLSNDPEIIVLSSQHHYYYDADEIKNVRTVINLKALNQIKEVKSFLHSIFQLLPKNSNFIGCFVDNRKLNVFEVRNNSATSKNGADNDDLEENGIVSNIPFINMIYSIMDLRTNKYMSARSVMEMLEENGLIILDMKEINGLTYFHSQKRGSGDE
jgi:hypothetical protein